MKNNKNETNLFEHPDAHRILKNLIQLNNQVKDSLNEKFSEKIQSIVEIIQKNIVFFVNSRAIFILLSIIENTNFNEIVNFFF